MRKILDTTALIAATIEKAVFRLTQTVEWVDSFPVWRYAQRKAGRYNDLVHQGFMLEGLGLYQQYGGTIDVSHILSTGNTYMVACLDVQRKKILSYPTETIGSLTPDRLFGAGQLMEYLALHGEKKTANEVLAVVYAFYGIWPNIMTYPADMSAASYSERQVSFLLLGLASLCYES